jgi:hypothetical protein
MGLFNKSRVQCREFQTRIEDAATAAPAAKEVPELLAALPAGLKEHAVACLDCRTATENILAARSLLSEIPSHGEMGGPWFAPRVMAAIAARSAELYRAPDTWTFLPKLAARLTWASAIALLLASGWLYQKPATDVATTKSVVTDITGEPVVPNTTPANNDEVLVSLAERPQ